MSDHQDRQIYEVKLFRPEYSAEAYQEVVWRGMVRMNRVEREKLELRCQMGVNARSLTIYSIVPIPESIPVGDLGRHLPIVFREILGYGGPNALRMVP